MIKPPAELTQMLEKLRIKCNRNPKHGTFLLSEIRKHELKTCEETSSESESVSETQL